VLPFHEHRVTVIGGLAGKGEAIHALAAVSDDLLVKRSRVADLLLCDTAQGHVALDIGTNAGPLRMSMAYHQFIVGGAQHPLPERYANFGIEDRGGPARHHWSSSRCDKRQALR